MRVNKLVAVVVVILALLGVVIGAEYWSGRQAERWYQEALAEGSKNPTVKLNTVRYERGLFSSHAVTRIQLVLPEGSDADKADTSFSVRQDLYHGPLPLAGWGVPGVPMVSTGAVVRTTLDLDSNNWIRKLAKLYKGQDPVTAISQVGFDGASNTRMTMPPLTLNHVKAIQSLEFSGLQGRFQIAPRGAAVQGEITIPSLEIVGQPTAAEGQSASGDVRVNLRDVVITTDEHKGLFDLMLGESSLKAGELRIQDTASGAVGFSHLSVTTNAVVSPQNPQQVNAEVLFKSEKITADPWSGTGSLRMAFHNLDGATTGKLQQWQQKAVMNPGDSQQALAELLDLVKALLRGKPEFVLDSQAKLAQGDWQGNLTLNFQDIGQIDLQQNPESLLGVLEKGLAEMTVSKALAEVVLTSVAKEQVQAQAGGQGGKLDDKAIQALVAQQVTQQLQGMTAAGFLRLEGDHYRSTARFGEGKLWVNDKEIPLLSPAAGVEDGATEDGVPLEPDGSPEEDGAEEAPQR